MSASLETLVVAAYIFADQTAIPRCGPEGKISDAELVALAVAQASMGIPSDRRADRRRRSADRGRHLDRGRQLRSQPPMPAAP